MKLGSIHLFMLFLFFLIVAPLVSPLVEGMEGMSDNKKDYNRTEIIVPTAVPTPAFLPAVVVVPIPTAFVAVNIPVTIAPELFAATLTSLPNLSASMPVKALPLPTKLVAVITPEVILFTVTSAAVPSARKIEISPPCPVILFIPDILFGRITVMTLFIIPPQNYHQHSKLH